MKTKILFVAFIAFVIGVLCSCERNEQVTQQRPILYVVNGSDYSANIYCDNHLVATAGAHNNSGEIMLTNTSVNLPVYVEAYFYDKKGDYAGKHMNWDYTFRWNHSYKMTLNNSKGKIEEL